MSEKQDTFFSALDNALAHGENAKSALISACEVYASIYWAHNEHSHIEEEGDDVPDGVNES